MQNKTLIIKKGHTVQVKDEAVPGDMTRVDDVIIQIHMII
jgi:hypothetical protein